MPDPRHEAPPVTALMTTRPDPFTDAVCREPERLARWWDVDARDDERKVAAQLCCQCPARTACGEAAELLGNSASGTWAGKYRPFTIAEQADDEALTEFLAVFGPSSVTSDNPMPTTLEPKPLKYGRYWIHPAQLRIEYREAN